MPVWHRVAAVDVVLAEKVQRALEFLLSFIREPVFGFVSFITNDYRQR